jgi:uncharacterized protein YbaP (TraB family)
MLKRLVVMVLLALCAPTMAASLAQSPRTLLWTVTSKTRTLYLTGDTQVLLPRDLPLPAPIVDAFNDAGELVLEGDPGADSTKVSLLIRQLGLLPAPEKLADNLDQADATLVQQVSKRLGVPFEKVQSLRPWLAALVLENAAYAELGCDAAQQVTNHFYGLAKSRNLPITTLETADAQFGLFANLPKRLQIEWLIMTARQWMNPADHLESERESIVEAWHRGDTDVLAKALLRRFEGHGALYEALVARRNEAWLNTLEAKLESHGPPIFVLVGAGHLVGAGNLVSLLERAGYHATR